MAKDKVKCSLDEITGVSPFDGSIEIDGCRVVEQDGAVNPPSKSTIRKGLVAKGPRSRYYPSYIYALNSASAESGFEVPRVQLCYQLLEDVMTHIPYHKLPAKQLNTAILITPELLSQNIIPVWDDFRWAEKEFLIDRKENKYPIPLSLNAAMLEYIADPRRYAANKCAIVKSIKENQSDRLKHIRGLEKLQIRLMDCFQPSLVADVVDEIMQYKPKKK